MTRRRPGAAFPAASASSCADRGPQGLSRSRLMNSLSRKGAHHIGDSVLRFYRLVSGVGALLIAIAPYQAAAQTPTQPAVQPREEAVSVRERPHPDYDPLGMRFGSFNLHASLGLAATSTDNLFAAESGSEVDDIVYSETPNVRLSSDWSRNALTFETGGTFTQHRDFSNEDADSYFARVGGRIDVGTGTAFDGDAAFAHLVTPRTDPDSPSVGSPVEYDRSTASVGVQHQFARFRVRGDVRETTYNYDGSQSFRDNDQTLIRGRLDAELTPRIGLSLQAAGDSRDYDNTPGLSSDSRTYLGGVTLNNDLLRGELSAGWFERKFDDPSIGTIDGLAVAGSLEWYVTELTTVSFDARRDADAEVSATSGLPYTTTQYDVRVDHELLRNVILTAGYLAGKRDYQTIDRNDHFQSFDVGADYVLNRRVAVRFRYVHDQNNSQDIYNRDYEVNAATIGLSLRL